MSAQRCPRPSRRPVPAAVGVAARVGTPPDAAPAPCSGPTTCSTTTNGRCCSCCSVFAGGFDLAAARPSSATRWTSTRCWTCWIRWCASRSSPPSASAGHARYGLLETIRQFAEEQLGRHRLDRRPSATVTLATSPIRPSPTAISGTGPANASRSIGWTSSSPTCAPGSAGRPTRATSTPPPPSPPTPPSWAASLQRFEPVGWVDEILDAATAADVRRLPRLYTAAGVCSQIGRPQDAVGYTHTAVGLATDPRYDPFEPGISGWFEAAANLYAGQMDRRRTSTPAWSGYRDWHTSPVW